MAIFDIDENMITDSIIYALEQAAYNASEEQFIKITETVNESFPGIVETITYGMMVHWRTEAHDCGTGWGEKYANAIDAKTDGNIGEVFIDEDMVDKQSNKPNIMFVKMVEEGMKSWSIKKALLASDKAKIGPSGVRYITVPFPVATPRKANQGTMQRRFGQREMTQEMYKIVKSGGKLKSGVLKTGENVAGLVRYQTRQRHSGYGIFRRVSENSKGWQYPTIGATPVYQKVLAEVNKRIHETIVAFCNNVVKEFTS